MKILFAMQEYQAAKRIGIYLSMPSSEIDTAAVVRHALATGKKVFVPYTYKLPPSSTLEAGSVMDMVALHSLSDYESLKPDKWGIPTPPEGSVQGRENCFGYHGLSEGIVAEMNKEAGLDLIVMPGIAFDVELRRLGHGKGFYDSFLTRYNSSIVRSERLNIPRLGMDGIAQYMSLEHS